MCRSWGGPWLWEDWNGGGGWGGGQYLCHWLLPHGDSSLLVSTRFPVVPKHIALWILCATLKSRAAHWRVWEGAGGEGGGQWGVTLVWQELKASALTSIVVFRSSGVCIWGEIAICWRIVRMVISSDLWRRWQKMWPMWKLMMRSTPSLTNHKISICVSHCPTVGEMRLVWVSDVW